MAEPSEVRAWARDNGYDVNARGAIPEHIMGAYDDAHSPKHDDVGPADLGVTEADFPPPDDDGSTPEAPPKRERKPRAVKPPRPSARKGWKHAFGGILAKARPKGPRTDLSEFAEDTWRDLAMLSAGIMPPVSRVLTIQAPYAGVVFDQAVKGLPVVDAVLQPVALASVSLRALNGLIGPAFFTAAITVSGGWQVTEDGKPVITEDGRPVPDQRTALMFGGLKYSLLQMSRTADLSKVQERAEVDAERMRAVDALVDFIFGFPVAAPKSPAPADGTAPPSQPHAPAAPGQALTPTFIYPPPPQMDDVGAPA